MLKRYKSDLTLPHSHVIPGEPCSKKLLQIMQKDEEINSGFTERATNVDSRKFRSPAEFLNYDLQDEALK